MSSVDSSSSSGFCPHCGKLKAVENSPKCSNCERELELKNKIAELDQKMVEQKQALESKEREIIQRRYSITDTPTQVDVEKEFVGRQLVSLSMEEVTILMMCLKMPVTEKFIYDNLIDGNMLSVVEKMEDLVHMGFRLNPLKSKVLFYNILSFKTEGVPDRFLDRLAAAASPDATYNLNRLVPRSTDVGKLSESQKTFFSGQESPDKSTSRGTTPGRLSMSEVSRFLSTSNITTPEISPRLSIADGTTAIDLAQETSLPSIGIAVSESVESLSHGIAIRLEYDEDVRTEVSVRETKPSVVFSDSLATEPANMNEPDEIQLKPDTVVADSPTTTVETSCQMMEVVSSSPADPVTAQPAVEESSPESQEVMSPIVEDVLVAVEEKYEIQTGVESVKETIEVDKSDDLHESMVAPANENVVSQSNTEAAIADAETPPGIEDKGPSGVISEGSSVGDDGRDPGLPVAVEYESPNDPVTAVSEEVGLVSPTESNDSSTASSASENLEVRTQPPVVASPVAPTVAARDQTLSTQSSLLEIFPDSTVPLVSSDSFSAHSTALSPLEMLDSLVSPVLPSLMNLFPTVQEERGSESSEAEMIVKEAADNNHKKEASPSKDSKVEKLSLTRAKALHIDTVESPSVERTSTVQLKPTVSFMVGFNESLNDESKTLSRTFSKRSIPLPRQKSRDTNSIPLESPKKVGAPRRKSETSATLNSSGYSSATNSPAVSMWASAWGNMTSIFTDFSITPGVMTISSSEHAIEALQILNESASGSISEAAVISTLRDIKSLINNNRDSLKGVNDKGGILLVAQVLSKHKESVEVVRPLVTVLKIMSTELEYQKLFGVSFISELLMGTLDRFYENEALVEDLCTIVQNMTANDCKHNIALLDSDGVCVLLVDVLKQHRVIPSVCLTILKAMSNITIYEQCMRFLGKAGLCECIVDVLRCHLQDGAIVCAVCRIVQNLAVDEANELTLMRQGIAEPLVLCLQMHESNDMIVADVCDAVAHMSFHGVHQARFGALKACEMIVKLLRKHEYKECFVEAACGAIKNLAMDALNEVEFGRVGACELLTDLLKLHSQSEVLVTVICAAIKNITFDDENRARFGSAGACELLLELACIHKKNERIRAAVKNLRANELNRKRFHALGVK